jgi:DMSO/TMAO reductase YedYZ heme-binding membrane subunit
VHLDPKTWWYLSRAGGFVAWALLATSVLWGLFITNRTLSKSTPPAWVLDLHRHLGGLAVAFVAVHIGVLPLDGFTHWSAADLFVPMHSTWHPAAVAWGVVAMYLLLAIEITSLMGRRFPRTWWRRVHMLSFPLYVLASIHLFAAGTDARNTIAQWMVVIVSTLVAFLAGVRLLAVTNPRETRSRVPSEARSAATIAPGRHRPAKAAVAASSATVPRPAPAPAGAAAAPPDDGPTAPLPAGAAAAAMAVVSAALLPGRPVDPAASRAAPEPAPAAPPHLRRPATGEERAARIREVARRAAARQATAPDARSAAMSASANPHA